MYVGERPTFRRFIPFQFSRSKSKPNKKAAGAGGWFLASITNRPSRWRQYAPPKRWALSEPHGVIRRKTALLILLFPYRSDISTNLQESQMRGFQKQFIVKRFGT
jgi:hypothetical protein